MEYGTFLVRFHSVMESAENDEENDDEEVLGPMVKPKLEERRFKSHTLDNVRVRKLCDELLYLEDMSYKMRDPSLRQRGWMPTLQVMMGKHVNGLEIRHNPDLTIGGYFLLAQMLTLTRGLTHLDLSGNNITSADARVLALGIGSNCSVQQLRMKENNIGSEGATNFADSLKKNKTLLILDLRMNNIRGNGVCVLADALSVNRSLTKLDLSWNYAGDSSDYVECALLDLKKFCRRNTDFALNDIRIAIGNPTGTRPTVARQQLFSPPAVTPQGSKLSQQTDRVSHGDISAAVQQAQAIQDRQLAHENWVSDEELNASMRSQEGAPLELLSQSPGGAAAMEDETSSAALSRKETQTSDGDITAAAMAGRFREKDSPAPNVRGSPAPAGAAPLAVPHRLRDAGGEEGQCTHGLRAELDSGVAKECIGRVEITVLSCKNLPQVIWTTGRNGEFLGQPQPYCTVSVCNEEHATGVRPRSFTPSWDNMCTMSVASVWNVATVTVMHTRSKRQRPPGQRRGDSNIGAVSVPVGSVMNWRGVSKTTDGSYRAFHRPFASPTGTVYTVCAGKDAQGNEVDSFGSAVQAALAYDEVASRKDGEKAQLNCSGEASVIGMHVKEEEHALTGEDGNPVIGVQAGIQSSIRLRIKYFSLRHDYLEIAVERASNLPKMDAGLGTCDAYLILMLGEYKFRSRVVRNSLDPKFAQTFRIEVPPVAAALACKMQIWDWDRFDDDDHMGDAEVQLEVLSNYFLPRAPSAPAARRTPGPAPPSRVRCARRD